MWRLLLLIHAYCATVRCLGTSQLGADTHSHIFKESIPSYSTRDDLIKRESLDDDHIHEVVFAVRQNNMDELIKTLHDVSDPFSRNYGRHMSSEQVAAMTMNPVARDAIADHLNEIGATITSETLNGDFISASAPVSVWGKVFNTKFYLFHLEQPSGEVEEIVRAESYYVPKVLHKHVDSVFNTIDIPVMRSSYKKVEISRGDRRLKNKLLDDWEGYGFNLPSSLRKYYNLSDVYGSNLSTQAAAGLGRNYFSPVTLAYFQANISHQPVQKALLHGGYVTEDPALECGEAALDMQYLMGISPRSPTTFWHASIMINLLIGYSNDPNPPLVLSISYGLAEWKVGRAEKNTFTQMAQKLGVMGVTILVASGDDGANNRKGCGYTPDYPSTNPYVTAVGATMVKSHHISSDFYIDIPSMLHDPFHLTLLMRINYS
jgi:subtilase family serine protease